MPEPTNQTNEPIVTEPTPTQQTEPNPEPTQTAPTPAVQPKLEDLIKGVEASKLVKIPVIQSLLEDARTQEKNKLYKTIEGKDKEIKALQDTNSDLEKQIKNVEGTNVEKEQELLQAVATLKEQQDILIKKLADAEAEKEQAQLDAYKKDLLATANGEVITSLVRGTTKEEIDSSFEVAKQEYLNITAPLKAQIEQSKKPNPDNAPKPQNPSTPSTLDFTTDQIKAMSATEYAKYREQLLRSIK